LPAPSKILPFIAVKNALAMKKIPAIGVCNFRYVAIYVVPRYQNTYFLNLLLQMKVDDHAEFREEEHNSARNRKRPRG